jgi:protein-S-isoprenylcysteine O-methyltransferase Ste14
MELLAFAAALAAYYALHSLLAAGPVRKAIGHKLMPVRYYRLFYNALAFLLLLPLAGWFFFLEKINLLPYRWPAFPGALLVLAGLVWLARSFRGYDLGEFIGTYQLQHGGPPPQQRLNTSGLNAQVRHPLYFGTLLALWGTFLLYPTDASLLVAGVSTLYLLIGSKLEERKLEQQFGDAYRSYQRKVPMLIPFKWRHSKN